MIEPEALERQAKIKERRDVEKAKAWLSSCLTDIHEHKDLRFTECRPDFGSKQVRSPEDIVLGDFYISRNIQCDARYIHQIISIDKQSYIAAWHVKDELGVHHLYANRRYPLSDCSIVPYATDSGEPLWNNVNFLEHLVGVKTPKEAFALVGIYKNKQNRYDLYVEI